MSKQIVENYTFNTVARTLQLNDYTVNGIILERLQLVVDTTLNQILYNFADASVSQISVSGNTITFGTLPVGVNNTDSLQIIYANLTSDPNYESTFIADGAAVTIGSTQDTAVTGDQNGSLSSKLRGLSLILTNVWDSVNGFLNVNLASALRQDLDSITSFSNGKLTSLVITTSGTAVAVPGKIHGIFVSAASGTPTITGYDGTNTSGVVKVPTFIPNAGQMYSFPSFVVSTAFYLNLTGTITLVVYYDTSTS